MSHDEKLMLLRSLDEWTTEEVIEASKRYSQMNQIEMDECNGR